MSEPDVNTIAGILAVTEDDEVIAELLRGWFDDNGPGLDALPALASPAREVAVALAAHDLLAWEGAAGAWEAAAGLIQAARSAFAEVGLPDLAAALARLGDRPGEDALDALDDELDDLLDDVPAAVVAFARAHAAALSALG